MLSLLLHVCHSVSKWCDGSLTTLIISVNFPQSIFLKFCEDITQFGDVGHVQPNICRGINVVERMVEKRRAVEVSSVLSIKVISGFEGSKFLINPRKV